MSPSNMSLSQYPYQEALAECEWEHTLGQLYQQLEIQEQASETLKVANTAFAAQCTEPDGQKYTEACDRLAKFLDVNPPLNPSQQQSLVEVLQIACAMHENALNNPALTEMQRSAHELASASFVHLCEKALEGSIADITHWCEVFSLRCRVEKDKPIDDSELDLSKYFDFETMTDIHLSEAGAVPSLPVAAASRVATPRASVHDITDVGQTPRSAKLKEKALAMLKDRPSKGTPLGRAHTMPTLSRSRLMSISHSSRTGRTDSKPYSRRQGLQALQEVGE